MLSSSFSPRIALATRLRLPEILSSLSAMSIITREPGSSLLPLPTSSGCFVDVQASIAAATESTSFAVWRKTSRSPSTAAQTAWRTASNFRHDFSSSGPCRMHFTLVGNSKSWFSFLRWASATLAKILYAPRRPGARLASFACFLRHLCKCTSS